jgi:exopolyphosphatase/guanosine-5'-triphosphate,3'-diphosphate pyrophosphatase
MGSSDAEFEIIANIARYHSEENPAPFHENYYAMPAIDRIIVAKLAAILKLADSLDIAHKQKIPHVEIARHGNELHFCVPTMKDILLEKWSFETKSTYFEEVMGHKPVFIVRGEKG